MRSISANGLAVLAQRLGNEPIMIVEVDWRDGVQPKQYADRTITPDGTVIPGAIIQIGNLDDAIDVTTWNNSSKQIEVTLDDTDGSIKALFDYYDITKRTVRLYQWFTGLDWSDRFVAFVGLINSPVSWSERDRTVKITVLSQIEDLECGFSAEEGNFPYIPADLVGKAWPQVFGLVYDYPALSLGAAVDGTLLQGVGIVTEYGTNTALNGAQPAYDPKSLAQLAQETIHAGFLLSVSFCWDFVDAATSQKYLNQANAIYAQIGQQEAGMVKAAACAQEKRVQQYDRAHQLLLGSGANPVQILGGEDFPQNQTVTLDIKGALFTGYFQGEWFYIESGNDPTATLAIENAWYNEWLDYNLNQALPACHPVGSSSHVHYEAPVPCDSFCGDFGNPCIAIYDAITITTPIVPTPATPYILKQFWADAGTTVKLYMGVTYIASITPGTVLAVKAYRTYNGARQLVVLTPDMYTVQTVNYGSITAVEIVLPQLLSTVAYQDANGDLIQGWSDDLYVTFQSTVGPNIVDILEYIIDNYTTLTYDATSFNYVRTKLVPFPANFPLLQRKNVVEVLKEIAFQSRCAFWLEDNVVYLKYLAEEPTPVDTITPSDIDAEQGMEVEFTRMEDVVTKMNVKWYMTYVPGAEQYAAGQEALPQYMILRHNVAHYGLLEKDYEWYIFNQPDIILKMATFWLNRLSNTWKRLKFRTYLNHLNLEALDCVNFNAPGYVASSPVSVIVERAEYDSANNCIDIECATPVKAGALAADPYYWPAALSPSVTYPSQADIAAGNAGGGGIGMGATGALPVGNTDGITLTGSVFVGGPNIVFGGQSDWGDRTPGDEGFSAQPLLPASSFSTGQATSQAANARLVVIPPYVTPPADPMVIYPDPATPVTLDLTQTKITDSQGGTRNYGTLRQVFALGANGGLQIDVGKAQVQDSTGGSGDSGGANANLLLKHVLKVQQNELMIDGNAQIITDDCPDGAQFDYEYDEDNDVLGAGTAFLQDDSGDSSGGSGG